MSAQILYERTFFADTNGLSLDSGNLYIGEAYQDPELFPVAVYWDANLGTPAAQPLDISGGYIIHNGARAAVYIDADSYSMRVRNKFGVQIDYVAQAGSEGAEDPLLPYTAVFTATAGQAAFTLPFEPTTIAVWRQGIRIMPSAFGLAGTTLTLSVPADLGDKVLAIITTTESHLEFFQVGAVGVMESIFPFTESISQGVFASTSGNYGLTTFSRSSDNPNSNQQSTTGVGFFALQDNTVGDNTVYGAYGEMRAYPDTWRAHVMELNAISLRPVTANGPSNTSVDSTLTEVLRLTSGRQDVFGSLPVTSYLTLAWNGATAKTGIVIGEDALDSNGLAIAVCEDHSILFTERGTGAHHSQIWGNKAYYRVDSDTAWYEDTFFRARAGGGNTVSGDIIARQSFSKFAGGSGVSVAFIEAGMKGANGGYYDINAKNSSGNFSMLSLNRYIDNAFTPNIGSSVALGGVGKEFSELHAAKIMIAGTLRTLSVDGSGFVKATP